MKLVLACNFMTIGLWHEDIIGYFQSNLFCGTAHLFEGQYPAARSNDNVMVNLDRHSSGNFFWTRGFRRKDPT